MTLLLQILAGFAAAVTATFNSEFVASAAAGALIECTGEVIRSTRHLIFVRGLMRSCGEPIFAFSGTLKRIRASAPDRH
jgi:acyl-coenzyme A thioesterase PaaI-like protein